jgi:hypothetical protein
MRQKNVLEFRAQQSILWRIFQKLRQTRGKTEQLFIARSVPQP